MRTVAKLIIGVRDKVIVFLCTLINTACRSIFLASVTCFLFSIDFLLIYVYCRKFNAEFDKLIKTVGHHARFFEK